MLGVMTRTSKKFIIMTVVIAVLLGVAAATGSLLLRRDPVVRQYTAQGFQMVDGCNGGAANGARAEVYSLQERLEDFADSPTVDTNMIARLKRALAIAKEMEQVLRDDCARRGHRETHPWKTNWATIKEALTASEKLYR
jgi:hypothetical protein